MDFSPTTETGDIDPLQLSLPKKIILKDNHISTQIDGKTWKLTYNNGRYIASNNAEEHDVTYINTEEKWYLLPADTQQRPNEEHDILPSSNVQLEHRVQSESIRTNIVAPKEPLREEEKHLTMEDQQSSASKVTEKSALVATSSKARKTPKIAKTLYRVSPQKNKIPRPRRARINQQQLRDIYTLGSSGISAAGGLQQLAQQKNIPLRLLRHYINDNGMLTTLGQDLLYPAQDKINLKLLHSLYMKGPQGIKKAGGLSKIARIENIPIGILRKFIRKNGPLTNKGKKTLKKQIKYKFSLIENTPERKKPALNKNSHQSDAIPSVTHTQQESADAVQTSLQHDNAERPSTSQSNSKSIIKTSKQANIIAPHAASANIIPPDMQVYKIVRRRRDLFGSITLSAPIDGHSWELLYNLEENVFYMGYRDYLGKWQRVTDTPYITKEGKNTLQELNNESARAVTDEQRTQTLKALGCNLDITEIERWTSQYHAYAEIPRSISSIWIGNKEIPRHLLDILKNNADLAYSSTNIYTFTLYLSRRDESAYKINTARLTKYAPSVTVVALEDTPFFEKFTQHKNFEQYNAATSGIGGAPTCFSAGVDILRFPLLNEIGGIYMDVDDRLVLSPGEMRLTAPPDGFVLSAPMSHEQLGMIDQYPTSIFGTHKNNPTLEKVSDTIHVRYQSNKDIYSEKPSQEDEAGFARYAQRISYLTGPDMFDAAISASRYEESQVLEAHRLWRLPLDDDFKKLMQLPTMKKIYKVLSSDIIKLADIVKIGGENSWQHQR